MAAVAEAAEVTAAVVVEAEATAAAVAADAAATDLHPQLDLIEDRGTPRSFFVT